MFNSYESPLSVRYATKEMRQLFSTKNRVQIWRTLWTELARAECELGLPITIDQVNDLEMHISAIDLDAAEAIEAEIHHDVMAQIFAYEQVAPSAAGIIHLGATSCYVTDNADLIIYKKALLNLRQQLCSVMSSLSSFAEQYKALPTVGYTHYQPALLVTVGKRASLWLQDFYSDLNELDSVLSQLKFLGCRGATGSEASLLELFDGDSSKVDELNYKLCHIFGFQDCFPICSQTYPRKLDSHILNCLSSIAQSCYRMANDIRLLQHDHEIEENFEKSQIGSSAMPFKQNPIHCERICSLSRYLMVTAQNAPITASVQWLERTLDDSANRRIALPEGFLCANAILDLSKNVIENIHVNEDIIYETVRKYLPFLATETLLMRGVKQGGNRQHLHNIIQVCAINETKKMKDGAECNLFNQLSTHPEFSLSDADISSLLTPEKQVGRCIEQVDAFLKVIHIALSDTESVDSKPIV